MVSASLCEHHIANFINFTVRCALTKVHAVFVVALQQPKQQVPQMA